MVKYCDGNLTDWMSSTAYIIAGAPTLKYGDPLSQPQQLTNEQHGPGEIDEEEPNNTNIKRTLETTLTMSAGYTDPLMMKWSRIILGSFHSYTLCISVADQMD